MVKSYYTARSANMEAEYYTSGNYTLIWLAEKYAIMDKRVGVLGILRDVCRVFEISEADMKSKKRFREVVIPRQIACYVSRLMTQDKLISIGSYFNFDHASVINHVMRVKNFLEIKDPIFMEYWNRYLAETRVYKGN